MAQLNEMIGLSMTYIGQKSDMHPKFDLTGVRTHGLQIMTVKTKCTAKCTR